MKLSQEKLKEIARKALDNYDLDATETDMVDLALGEVGLDPEDIDDDLRDLIGDEMRLVNY